MSSQQTLPSWQIVFDPRGHRHRRADPARPAAETLRGVRLGVLDNSKWNASRLLRHTAAAFAGACEPAEVHRYVKDSFSREATDALLDRIAAENDVVVTRDRRLRVVHVVQCARHGPAGAAGNPHRGHRDRRLS